MSRCKDQRSRCECGDPIAVGQRVIRSVDRGFLHLDCCDSDSFVDENDDPLKKGAPRPEGFIWTQEDEDAILGL